MAFFQKSKNSKGVRGLRGYKTWSETRIHEELKLVAQCIEKANHIVVLSGAGLSVSAGIPDFRSVKGFYLNPPEYLKKHNLSDPSDIFTLSYFKKNPEPFYEFAREFTLQEYNPTPAHHFIQRLNEKGKLRRYYTQNIDGLDEKTGDYGDKLVYCHGHFKTAKCISCRESQDMEVVKEALRASPITIPKCLSCKKGVVKPDVVFFGEELPLEFEFSLQEDISKKSPVDMLIVLGTSLGVAPVSMIPDMMPKGIPKVLVNMDYISNFGESENNYLLAGDLQESCQHLMKLLGWTESEKEKEKEKETIELLSKLKIES